MHAMERNPAQRHASARALQAELDLPAQVPVTGRCDRAEPVAPWQVKLRQHRSVILALGVPVLVPAAVALWLWLHHGSH